MNLFSLAKECTKSETLIVWSQQSFETNEILVYNKSLSFSGFSLQKLKVVSKVSPTRDYDFDFLQDCTSSFSSGLHYKKIWKQQTNRRLSYLAANSISELMFAHKNETITFSQVLKGLSLNYNFVLYHMFSYFIFNYDKHRKVA